MRIRGQVFKPHLEKDSSLHHSRDEYKEIAEDRRKYNMDLQLIPWKRIMRVTREVHRQRSNLNHPIYRARDSMFHSSVRPKPLLTKQREYFTYEEFYKNLNIEVTHHQLRNNICVSSEHNVYYLSEKTLCCLNDLTGEVKKTSLPIMDCYYLSVSTLDQLAAIGTIHGRLVLFDLQKDHVLHDVSVVENNEITNNTELFKELDSDQMRVITASNDKTVRVYDVEKISKPIWKTTLSDAVNTATISPDRKLIATFCDKMEAEIIDYNAKAAIAVTLRGHKDFGFSIAWHPTDGNILATTNQDATCRIWDIRSPIRPVEVLRSMVAHSNSVKFSPDGQYLAFCENSDYVHIYSTQQNYQYDQTIDVFGHINGVAFDPNEGNSLYFGVSIEAYAGIFKYTRLADSPRKAMKLESLLL